MQTRQQEETRRRNAEIREVHKRRALYGDRKATGLLTSRELRKEMKAMGRSSRLQRLWAKLTAMFNKGEAAI